MLTSFLDRTGTTKLWKAKLFSHSFRQLFWLHRCVCINLVSFTGRRRNVVHTLISWNDCVTLVPQIHAMEATAAGNAKNVAPKIPKSPASLKSCIRTESDPLSDIYVIPCFQC